jgi:hypothetical protein
MTRPMTRKSTNDMAFVSACELHLVVSGCLCPGAQRDALEEYAEICRRDLGTHAMHTVHGRLNPSTKRGDI